MGYKLSAIIADKSTQISPPEINLVSFGVWDNKEVPDHDCPEGILEDVRAQFRAMDKAKKGKRKPLTLSWLPLSDNKDLFRKLKKKSAKLRIIINVERYDKTAKWMLVFDDVEITDVKPFTRKFPQGGGKTYERTDERINTSFKSFEDDK